MKYSICMAACMLLFHSAVFTQSAATKDVPVRPAALRELHIGDRVPDLVVDNVLHYPGGTLKLSDFRGKLLILDFMSTGCKSCILKLPAYDSLQKQYGDRLQILLVTSGEKKYTGDVWKRNKFLSRITLPVVTEDSALAALFPHEVISHLAWIDAGGRVKAITTPQYVNAGNIDRVLNNEAVRWPVKKDILHFDRNIPLLEIYGNRPEYYSTLTGYIDGVPGVQAGFSTDSLRNTVRCFAFNRDVISLYKMTIYQGELAPNIPSGRLVKLETNDSSRFFYMDPSVYKDAWKSSNQYCYESVLPLSTPRQAVLQAMRADLNKFLGLNGRLEPVKVPVLVLTGAFNGKATDTGKEDRPLILIGPGAPDKYVRNARIPAVVNALNVQGTLPVIIDETGYGGLVSFDFGPIDISDYQAVKKVLESYGFHLSKAERYLDHLVITEPGYHIEKPR